MKCWDYHQKRDIDFTIDLVPGETPVSKSTYRMSTPEFAELNMQLHELIEKLYKTKCVSMGSIDVICQEEIWDFKVVY